MAVAPRLGENLRELLVQERPVRQAGQDVVLREPIRLRARDLELLRPLRDLVFERALVARDFPLRLREPLGHVVEGVGQEAQLVGRAHRNLDVEIAGPDRFRRAHQHLHRCDHSPGEHQRHADRRQQHEADDGQMRRSAAGGNSRPCAPTPCRCGHRRPDGACPATRRRPRQRGACRGRRRCARRGDQLDITTAADDEVDGASRASGRQLLGRGQAAAAGRFRAPRRSAVPSAHSGARRGRRRRRRRHRRRGSRGCARCANRWPGRSRAPKWRRASSRWRWRARADPRLRNTRGARSSSRTSPRR